MKKDILKRYDLTDKVVAITGGGGDLCGVMAEALGMMGVKVAVLDNDLEKAKARSSAIIQSGGAAKPLQCDVLNTDQVRSCYEEIYSLWGPPDFLINGAGGNNPRGTTTDEFFDPEKLPGPGTQSFFDLNPSVFRQVFELNFMSIFLVTQVFSRGMVEKGGFRPNAESDAQATPSWRYFPPTGASITYSKTALLAAHPRAPDRLGHLAACHEHVLRAVAVPPPEAGRLLLGHQRGRRAGPDVVLRRGPSQLQRVRLRRLRYPVGARHAARVRGPGGPR